MEIINYIKVNTESREMFPDRKILGVEGENEVEKLVFKLDKFFGGEARLETRQNDTLEYLVMETDLEKEEYSIVLTNELLKDYLSIDLQIRIINENGEVFKSKSETFEVLEGINATQEIVENQLEWVDEVDTRLDKAETDIEELKQNGTGGGTSDYNDLTNKPSINNIELNGNKTLDELNIQPKGNYVEDENYVHTDNNFTTEEKEKLQSLNNYNDAQIKADLLNKVDKVEGKSLIEDTEIARLKTLENYDDTELRNELANKVGFTDYATSSKAGIIRPANGLSITGTTGAVLIAKASNAQIDAKTDSYYPIVSSNLDYAVHSVVDSTIITEIDSDTLLLEHNQDARLGELSTLILNMPAEIDERYESCFSFRSGATATTLTYSATPIKWQGDDCNANGEFIPESNTSYEISIRKVNDNDIVARVGGY